jgi:hypothetical protein
MSFLADFFGTVESTADVAVCCPFDHHTSQGIPYKESHPSAHINTEKHVFHCKVCGIGYSEQQFIQKILGCNYIEALKLSRCFNNTEDHAMWEASTTLTEESKKRALSLGISEETLNELEVKTPSGTKDLISFPAFMFDHLVDIRKYDPGQKPKVKSRFACPAGLIIPFDIWKETPLTRMTLICAGEKDMANARSRGFNAITITGGEHTLPIPVEYFKDRAVAIVYDNDEAGISGAKRLAATILQYTPNVRVVTNFHQICCEKGEDITDFFIKYNKSKDDLITYIEQTEIYTPTPEDKKQNYPMVDLLTATKPENINKLLQSNIQVVATSEASFVTPAYAIAKKMRMSGAKNGDSQNPGYTWEWSLNDDNLGDVLHLMDNNFKEEDIKENLKNLMYVPKTERCVAVTTLAKKTVFKAFVTDMFETNDANTQPMEFTAYTIDCKLESGKKYLVTYKLVPHPYKGQQLTMLITGASQADDSVSNFTITDTVKQNLDIIKNLPGTVEERINDITERMKGLIGYNGNNRLIQGLDLAYHTVLQFNFGSFKNVRGYLDTIVIGESRVGKSSTAETLRKTYGLGIFTSLAGNSATVPGLVGGSNKTANGFQTRAGIIPQNHRGLIIFEEFGKSNTNVIKELTDIRSSNEVRIARVSGTITLPAMVRMISLSNVKATDGTIKPIASYPNGISIITELVETAEDIARYDMMIILADKGAAQIDPFWEPAQPFDGQVYKDRIRWIWSRTPEQIIISKEVGLYVMEKANALNQTYECHIKIFGTECWKKVCRLAIAIAGYLVSATDDYTGILVKKEHVDYAVKFFEEIYDNSTFKLKEYVNHERQFTQIDDEGIAFLQDIYNRNPGLVLQLEQCATANKNMLGGATGLSNDDLNKALQNLTKGLFVRFSNHEIIPTERFRLGVAKINKHTFVQRLGEPNVTI